LLNHAAMPGSEQDQSGQVDREHNAGLGFVRQRARRRAQLGPQRTCFRDHFGRARGINGSNDRYPFVTYARHHAHRAQESGRVVDEEEKDGNAGDTQGRGQKRLELMHRLFDAIERHAASECISRTARDLERRVFTQVRGHTAHSSVYGSIPILRHAISSHRSALDSSRTAARARIRGTEAR
jgi:hypothetical protein